MHGVGTPSILARTFAALFACLLPSLPAATPAASSTNWNVFPARPLVDLPNTLPADPVLLHALGASAELVVRWKPPENPDAWSRRRPEVAAAFRKSLGLDPLPPRTPLNARLLERHEFEGYTVQNVIFESRPGFPVTANLYRPSSPGPARRPAVLSPIGHFLTPGKTATDVQSRCIQLARLGFVVLAYDAIGQGERLLPGNIHHDAGYSLLTAGETIAGWMVWDSMRALDFLAALDDVDPARLGITGNSGGGLNSLIAAALDDRIRAAVVVGFTFEFGNWLRYGGAHCTCTHLPGAFRTMNWFEIAGLIAPRALLLIQGENDAIFPISGARTSAEATARVFDVLGRPEAFRFVELAGQPHAYTRPFREPMYGWMTRHLRDASTAAPIPEPPLAPLPEKDPRLLCDPDGTRLASAETVVSLTRRRLSASDQPREATRDPQHDENIRRWISRLVPAADRTRTPLLPRFSTPTAFPGGTVEKVHFSSEDGLRLPVLWWRPASNSVAIPPRVVVLVDSRGKSAVADSGWVPSLLAAGYTVVAPDLRGRGETLGRYGPRYDTNFRLVANQILAGEPLPARRAYDLLRVIDLIRQRSPESPAGPASIFVVALADDTLPALLAAVVEPRIDRLVLSGGFGTMRSWIGARAPVEPRLRGEAWNDPQLQGRIRFEGTDDEFEFDFGNVLPDAWNHADIPDLLALLAPRRVWIGGLRDATDPMAGKRSFPPGIHDAPRQNLDVDTLLAWLR